jgi:hypothetical protein
MSRLGLVVINIIHFFVLIQSIPHICLHPLIPQSLVEEVKVMPKNILVLQAEELLAECSGTLNLLLTRVLPVCGRFISFF